MNALTIFIALSKSSARPPDSIFQHAELIIANSALLLIGCGKT
ncbi:MAG: hypothetical protein ACMUEK_00530 [Sodalis sp. (in: enterobacteria)]